MQKNIYHRGFKIIAKSHKNENGKWLPEALIEPVEVPINRDEKSLKWIRTFEDKDRADDFALNSAKLHIDKNY